MPERYPIDGAGYWITPTEFVVLVRTHISAICEYGSPSRFGVDEHELRRLFEAFKEPYGSEFTVRSHVIRCLVRVGWIRARNYYQDGWTLNAPDLSPRSLSRATGFFRLLYGRFLDFSPVRLDSFEGALRREVADFQTCRVFAEGTIPESGIPVLKYLPDARQLPLEGIPQVRIEIPLHIGHIDDNASEEADQLRAEARRASELLGQYRQEHPELRPKRRKRDPQD